MNEICSQTYDVVIMGAGFAGVCQARHLLLNIPNIKVALVDPRPERRTDKDLKIGESMIEVAALFVAKELGLYEYMVENHTPKLGLNFHWPKELATTETLDDYYHIWVNRQPAIASFHMNRAKFEQDVLQMNQEMGAAFYNGRVIDVDLTPGDALTTVQVKVGDQILALKAKHVVDAAGRKFLIGKKTDNVVSAPENLYGLNNGSAWLRVRNVDRTLFHNGSNLNGITASHYYATNHWFGYGHWLWMIPSDNQPLELSIGVVHHHDVIPAKQLNTQDKFLAFLDANHTILHKLVTSGEIVDFHYWPKLAHTSHKIFSEDNWYLIGDAAYIFDAFYSYGTTMAAFAIESVTEIIRAKLAGEADAEEKRSIYNGFNLTYAKIVNQTVSRHPEQLGNASIMSWRIYFEYIFWFGFHIAIYLGKWHLEPAFIIPFIQSYSPVDRLFEEIHDQFDELARSGVNIGFMDCYRADQLIGHYHTTQHFDDYLENAKLEPRRVNVFACMKGTFFYAAVWYVKFLWKGYGLAGLLSPASWQRISQLLVTSAKMTIAEMIYKAKSKGEPTNSLVTRTRREFKDYQYQAKLQPWLEFVPQTQTVQRKSSSTSVAVKL